MGKLRVLNKLRPEQDVSYFIDCAFEPALLGNCCIFINLEWYFFSMIYILTFANGLLYLDSLYSYNLSLAVVYDIFTNTFQRCYNAIEESSTMPQGHRNYPDWPDHGKTQPDVHHMQFPHFKQTIVWQFLYWCFQNGVHTNISAFSDRAPNIKQDCIRCHSILFTPCGMWLVCGC